MEDSFASRLSTYYRTSAQFMALYGLFNFYLYTMAYVYSPADEQVTGQRKYINYIPIVLRTFLLITILTSQFNFQTHR